MRIAWRSSGCAVVIAFALASALVASPASATSLPPTFVETQIGGLAAPTAMAFAPDGRLFVSEQTGRIRIVQNGALLPTPFATVTVDSTDERGLLGVAFPPDFATSHRLYAYFTQPTPSPHNVVVWFGGANGNVASSGPNVVTSLPNLGATNHNGGGIHFSPTDGQLYIGVGENGNAADAQDLTSPLGKILRIDASGSPSAGNPTFGGAPHDARVWAYGLRNPFTFGFQPGTGTLFIDDVGSFDPGACGSGTWEEIDPGAAGANYGWPFNEGSPISPACTRTGVTYPLFTYSHSESGSPCAIAGGTFYNPSNPQLGQSFVGVYFFSDLCAGWIRYRDPGGTVNQFASGISSPVDLQVAPDGALWYLSHDGVAGRIVANHDDVFLRNSPTTGVSSTSFTYGDPGDIALFCDWDGNGTDTVAVYRNGVFYLRNSNTPGFANLTVGFGNPGDTPLCGDWDGNGTDTVGVYRNGVFYLRNSNTPGFADAAFGFGNPGDTPLTGNWDGAGSDTIGVYRQGVFYLRNSDTPGFADLTARYGNPSDTPLSGDWDGNGTDTIAVWREGNFYLRDSNTSGFADGVAGYGNASDTPSKGNFDGAGGDGLAAIRGLRWDFSPG